MITCDALGKQGAASAAPCGCWGKTEVLPALILPNHESSREQQGSGSRVMSNRGEGVEGGIAEAACLAACRGGGVRVTGDAG